jgi:dTDP-4-amino-4,6-dideoxygalactose transaminase
VEVPFVDLGRLHRSIAAELDAACHRVIEASAFVGGPSTVVFEAAFAAASGRAGAVGCGSGTDALTLALAGLGIGPGDEVVVPAMTFVATAEAVVHAGAVPVLADVDADSLLLTAPEVARVRTDRTRAVIPVHLYGHVVAFDLLEEWRESGLVVVEDAAQAHLATWRGRPVGSVGHAACFSFYPGKNLGALGDGGAVVSDDQELLARVACLRDHGSTEKGRHDVVGWCSRLDGMQAAWLEVKLRHLPAWTARRRLLAEHYRQLLPDHVVGWENGAVHHLVVVRVPAARRHEVMASLGAAGVQTGVHYRLALSQQPALRQWARPCPEAEGAAAEVVSLPLDPLMDESEVDHVASALLDALGGG